MNVTLWMELVVAVFVVAACIVLMRTCSRLEVAMLELVRQKEAAPVKAPAARRKKSNPPAKKATHVCVACALPLPADPTSVLLKDGAETFVYACSCGTELRSSQLLSEEVVDDPV